MPETDYTRLVRDIEIGKGKLSAHERECTTRMANIDKSMETMKSDIAAILRKVDAQVAGANKWVLGVAAAIILLLLGGLGWSTGQVYQLQTERVSAQTQLK